MLARKEDTSFFWFDTSSIHVHEPLELSFVITPKSGKQVVVTTQRAGEFKVFVPKFLNSNSNFFRHDQKCTI